MKVNDIVELNERGRNQHWASVFQGQLLIVDGPDYQNNYIVETKDKQRLIISSLYLTKLK